MPSAEEFLHRCNSLFSGSTPEAILRNALELLRDPRRWAQGHRCVDAQGRRVHVTDERAVKWDIEGAVALMSNPFGILPPFFMALLDRVAEEYGSVSVNEFNETYDHHMVIEFMAKAIKAAEQLGRRRHGVG